MEYTKEELSMIINNIEMRHADFVELYGFEDEAAKTARGILEKSRNALFKLNKAS